MVLEEEKDRENKCEKLPLGPSAHSCQPDFTMALQRASPSCLLSDSRSSALVCDILLPPKAYPESRWPINVSSWCRLTCKCCESDRSWQCMEGHLPHVCISFVPSRSQGNVLVHLNTDVTVFVGDHVFFSLNSNAVWVMFSLKRKAQGLSASGYKMIPGSIPGSKQVEYTSPRLIQQYHQCQCVSTGCWLLVIRT